MNTVKKLAGWLGAAGLVFGLVWVSWRFYQANKRAQELIQVTEFLIKFPVLDLSSLAEEEQQTTFSPE